jgi:hypothetical protein
LTRWQHRNQNGGTDLCGHGTGETCAWRKQQRLLEQC